MKPEARETRYGWIVAAVIGFGALAAAMGVRTPQQTTADLRQDVDVLKVVVQRHDVTIMGQGKDIEYIKDAVDEIRGHHGAQK